MKRIIPFFIIITQMIFISCTKSYYPVKFKINKSSILYGDSVKISWRIRKTHKFSYALLNKNTTISSFKEDTFLFFDNDTVITFSVYDKRGNKLTNRRRKVRVKQPQILSFSAFRDRFNPQIVTLAWATKNIKSISIEGCETNLPLSGKMIINEPGNKVFNLIGKTPFTTVKQSCFVDDNSTKEVFIEADTSIDDLQDNRIIKMKIVENDISEYPQKVKFKVLVYDTLGNFITNLAPPYGTSKTAKEYFRKIVEKSSKKLKDVSFTVREIHESPQKYDIAITLDYSGSMFQNIDSLESATKFFIENKDPNDQYSIVKYDDQLVEMCPLTVDVNEILKKSQFYGTTGLSNFGGGTALFAGSDKGLESLRGAKHQKVVLLFTDGFENSSLQHFGSYATNLQQLAHNVRLQNARMIIIGMGFVNQPLLRELSIYTNGSFYYVHYPQNIYKVYKELLHNFKTYYEITITPVYDKGEHLVQLTYFNRQDSATTQRSYYVGKIPIPPIQLQEDTGAYWYNKSLKKSKYKLAAPPQTLVNFQLDKHNIDKKYYGSLLNIIKFIKRTSGVRVMIYGHTDTHGTNQYNKKLSEQRAKSVRDFMVTYGVNPSIIKWQGMGEEHPVWKNDSADWAAAENRRVEIIIWKK